MRHNAAAFEWKQCGRADRAGYRITKQRQCFQSRLHGGSTAVTGLNNLAAYSVSNGDFHGDAPTVLASLPNCRAATAVRSGRVCGSWHRWAGAAADRDRTGFSWQPGIFQIALRQLLLMPRQPID